MNEARLWAGLWWEIAANFPGFVDEHFKQRRMRSCAWETACQTVLNYDGATCTSKPSSVNLGSSCAPLRFLACFHHGGQGREMGLHLPFSQVNNLVRRRLRRLRRPARKWGQMTRFFHHANQCQKFTEPRHGGGEVARQMFIIIDNFLKPFLANFTSIIIVRNLFQRLHKLSFAIGPSRIVCK